MQLNAIKPAPRITSTPGTGNGIKGICKHGPNQMRNLGVRAIAAVTRPVSVVITKINKCGGDQKVSKKMGEMPDAIPQFSQSSRSKEQDKGEPQEPIGPDQI